MADKELTPRESWYIAATSKQVKKKSLLSRKILNQNIVLYRNINGNVSAFEDICPHKRVPLSIGRANNNSLSCRYHGWEFDSKGKLINIPCKGQKEKLRPLNLSRFEVVEQDDWIWIWMSPCHKPSTPPPSYPKHKEFFWFEYFNRMKVPMDLVLENGLDCSHTGFVHKGLFRSEPTKFVDATIQKTETGVIIKTVEEKSSKKKDLLSFLSGGSQVSHTDEFKAPHTVEVDYKYGNSRLLTYLICTPSTKQTTYVYTRMACKYPFFNTFIGRFIKRVVRTVISQDKALLEKQATNVAWRERDKYILAAADLPTITFFKAFDQFCEGKILWNKNYSTSSVRYKL